MANSIHVDYVGHVKWWCLTECGESVNNSTLKFRLTCRGFIIRVVCSRPTVDNFVFLSLLAILSSDRQVLVLVRKYPILFNGKQYTAWNIRPSATICFCECSAWADPIWPNMSDQHTWLTFIVTANRARFTNCLTWSLPPFCGRSASRQLEHPVGLIEVTVA